MPGEQVQCDPLPKHISEDGQSYYMDFDDVLPSDVNLVGSPAPTATVVSGTITVDSQSVITTNTTVKIPNPDGEGTTTLTLTAYRAVKYELSGGDSPEDASVRIVATDDNGKTVAGTQPIEVRG